MKIVKYERIQETIKTYNILEPDINPFILEYLNNSMYYPYPFKNNISSKLTEKVYEVFILENNYFRVKVIPALGGKIYSMLDKRINKEIFYCNPVIKPKLISSTGAWSSGGVEFNFPLRGHRPSAMDYTDTKFKEYPDGSVSIIISEVGQVAWMRFSVELKLEPEKAFLEQIVRLFNPNELNESYYFWTTSSQIEKEDLEFRYPFNWYIEEETENRYLWPYAEDNHFEGNDVDLRFSKTMKSFTLPFGSEVLKDYMGLHYHKSDRGVAHVANYLDVPGKKIWCWGHSKAGNYWSKSLTDNNTRYVEMQSGDIETQNEFNLIKPFSKIKFKKYWLSYFDIGPLFSASKDIISSIKVNKNNIIFSFLGTDTFKNVKFNIFNEGSSIFTKTINISPLEAEKIKIPLKLYNKIGKITFLLTIDNKILLEDSIIDYSDALQLIKSEEYVPDNNSKNGINIGLEFLKRRYYNKAITVFNEIIENNPDYLEAYLFKVECLIKKRNFKKSLKLLEKIKDIGIKNNKYNYLYGVALWEDGDLNKSLKYFYRISHTEQQLFIASSIYAAKYYIKNDNFKQAINILKSPMLKNNKSYYNQLLSFYMLYKREQYDKLNKLLEEFISDNPYEYIALYFSYLVENKITKQIQENIFNKQNVYYLVDFFDQLGDKQICFNIINDYLNYNEKPNVLLKAYKNYYNEGSENASVNKLATSIKQINLDYVYPNHRLDFKLIGKCLNESPKANYLFGLLNYRKENYNLSISLWEDLMEANFYYSVLYRNLAYYYYKEKNNFDKAALIAEHGLDKKPLNPGLFHVLFISYKRLDYKNKIKDLIYKVRKYEIYSDELSKIIIDGYNYLGQYEKAAKILEESSINRFEHLPKTLISYRKLYEDTYLGLTINALKDKDYKKAWDYINKCLSYEYRYSDIKAEIYFYAGIIKEKLGQYKEALAFYKKVKEENIDKNDRKNYNYYVKAVKRIVKLNWLGLK